MFVRVADWGSTIFFPRDWFVSHSCILGDLGRRGGLEKTYPHFGGVAYLLHCFTSYGLDDD